MFVSAALAATTPIVGNVTTGKKLFKSHGCGTCHVLSIAGAFQEGPAPNLDVSMKTYALDIAIITNGSPKKGMNPYKRVFTTAEIQSLAALIYKASHPGM